MPLERVRTGVSGNGGDERTCNGDVTACVSKVEYGRTVSGTLIFFILGAGGLVAVVLVVLVALPTDSVVLAASPVTVMFCLSSAQLKPCLTLYRTGACMQC